MTNNVSWLGGQIKGYVASVMPSWNNVGNNVMVKNSPSSVNEKPGLSTNYISVTDDFFVQDETETDPFTVKALYNEV